MGVNDTLTKLQNKRDELRMDSDGIAPLIAAVIVMIVIGGITIAGVAVYQLTVKPDITYNITETGFSLAGIDVGSIWPIALIGGALILLYFMIKKK